MLSSLSMNVNLAKTFQYLVLFLLYHFILYTLHYIHYIHYITLYTLYTIDFPINAGYQIPQKSTCLYLLSTMIKGTHYHFWVCGLCVCVHVYITCVQEEFEKVKANIRSLWTGVSNGCEALCGCWEYDPGPLQEQEVLFNSWSFSPTSGFHRKHFWWLSYWQKAGWPFISDF